MKQIKHIFYGLFSKIKALKGKKIALIIAISTVVIAPTLLATGYVVYHEIAKPVEYFSVSLYDSKNELIAEESQTLDDMGSSSLLEIFYHLILDETRHTDPPETPDDRVFVLAKIDYNGTKLNIKCYFSIDPEAEGYYVDSQNRYYSIPKKLNLEFLRTAYAESFYDNAKVFTLTTADLDIITPKSIDWNYKTIDGQYLNASENQTINEIKTYEITSAIDIAFESKPDVTSVYVYSNEKLIYTGSAEALSSLKVDMNDVIRVYIEAKWLQINHRDYYGTVTYDFYVHIKNRSVFSISADTVRAGGFVFLDCSNVSDIKKLNFTSSRNGFIPVFKRYNNRWRTVIPFSESTNEISLSISVSYGASTESFSVQVLPPTEKSVYVTEYPIYSDTHDPKTIKQAIFSTNLSDEPLVYFRGNFEDPQSTDYTAVYTHGSTVKLDNDPEKSYLAMGNKYILKDSGVSGGSVRAIQSGVVTYIGYNADLGSFAVVDHGCGLRTWYAELGKIDVKVGDLLLSGQHVGKTGKDNFNDTEGFMLFCTAGDIMIDPETLWIKTK